MSAFLRRCAGRHPLFPFGERGLLPIVPGKHRPLALSSRARVTSSACHPRRAPLPPLSSPTTAASSPVIPGERRRREGRGTSRHCRRRTRRAAVYWMPTRSGMTGWCFRMRHRAGRRPRSAQTKRPGSSPGHDPGPHLSDDSAIMPDQRHAVKEYIPVRTERATAFARQAKAITSRDRLGSSPVCLKAHRIRLDADEIVGEFRLRPASVDHVHDNGRARVVFVLDAGSSPMLIGSHSERSSVLRCRGECADPCVFRAGLVAWLNCAGAAIVYVLEDSEEVDARPGKDKRESDQD